MQNGPIGEILVRAGLIEKNDAEHYARAAFYSKRSLQDVLVDSEVVSELQIVQAMANQLAVPWVTLRRVEFSRELLNALDAETAMRYRVLPVYKRRLGKKSETLFVAMEDPTNVEALLAVENATRRPVRPMIAPASEITDALHVYYGGPPALKKPSASSPEPVDLVADLTDYAAEALAHQQAKQRAQVEKPKMRSFTLLDGTEILLPAISEECPEQKPAALTASDIAKALIAQGQGVDVSDVMGKSNMEGVVAALLGLLVRKGLIADWEFIEAWAKSN